MKTVLFITASDARYFTRSNGLWNSTDRPSANDRLWVIANLPEETLEAIKLPPLFGPDRRRLLDRRLSTAFPHSSYRTATTVSGSRFRNSNVILAGLNDENALNDEVCKLTIPIAGVWGMAMLLTLMMKRLAIDNVILVMPGERDLRIVVVKETIPILTRCVPISVDKTTDNHDRIAHEILRTRQHMENRRLFDQNSPPPIIYIGDASAISQQLNQAGLTLLPLPEILYPKGDAAYLHPFFERVVTSPTGQLAPSRLRIHDLSANIRQAAYLGIAVSLMATMLFSQQNFRDAIDLHQRADRLNTELELATRERNKLANSVTASSIDPKRLRQLARFSALEMDTAPSPESILLLLAFTIEDLPQVRIKNLAYRFPQHTEPFCQGVTDFPDSDSSSPEHSTELQFTLLLPEKQDTASRIAINKHISVSLRKIHGIRLMLDPDNYSSFNTLKGGFDHSSANTEDRWCLSIPWQTDLSGDL